MRRIALVNQKGGVGKTTTAVNLSAAVARLGGRVLLLDLDPQANATVHLGVRPAKGDPTTYTLLSGQTKLEEVLKEVRPNLFLVPSSIELAGAEMELASAIGRERVLCDALTGLKDFDFIFIDCPPSLGLLNVNGLTFVDEVFVPLQCEFFALQGISLLMRTIDLVRSRLNPDLEVTGVIACMIDTRKTLARETLEEIEKFFGDRVFQTKIRTNVRLAEAPSHGKTIFDYAPDSQGARNYHALAREVLGLPPEDSREEPQTEAFGPPLPTQLITPDPPIKE